MWIIVAAMLAMKPVPQSHDITLAQQFCPDNVTLIRWRTLSLSDNEATDGDENVCLLWDEDELLDL